jgi:hypothetical protein
MLKGMQRRSTDAPRTVFALQCSNRQVWIYVAHRAKYALFQLDRKMRTDCP